MAHAVRGIFDRLSDERPPVATVALHPARDGLARLVPAGAVATLVVGLDDDELVVVETEPPAFGSVHNLGDGAIADRTLRTGTRTVIATGARALELHERAVDEWRVLMAGALVGLAGAALEVGVEYAKQRHQFGVPIGSFQAIAHDLADVATAVDGAQLLVREAAWAADVAEADATAAGADGVPVRGEVGAADNRGRGPCARRLRVHPRVRHPTLPPARQGVAAPPRRPAPRRVAPRGRALRPGGVALMAEHG